MNDNLYNDFEPLGDDFDFEEMYAWFDTPRGQFATLTQRMLDLGWMSIGVGDDKFLVRWKDHSRWHENNPSPETRTISRSTQMLIDGQKMLSEIDHVLCDNHKEMTDEYWEGRIENLKHLEPRLK